MINHPLTAQMLGMPSPRGMTAAIPLSVVGILLWKRRLPRIAACFALVAGTVLSSGWIYLATHRTLTWATKIVNLVTTKTVGGVVPGVVALVLTIIFVLEVRPDRAMLDRVASISSLRDVRDLLPAGRRGGGGRYDDDGPATGRRRRRYAAAEVDSRGRRPEKLAALSIGLVLPSVVVTIPGFLGVIAMSFVNVVGGTFAALIGFAWGLI